MRWFQLYALFMVLLCAACGPGEGVAIEDFSLSETAGSVLVWRVDVTTSRPTAVLVRVDGEEDEWIVEGTVMPKTEHEIVLAGLRAESTYDLTVEAIDEDGLVATETTSITTSPLPENLPPITVDVSRPEEMAEGFTLFNVFRWLPGESAPDPGTGWLLAVDSAGEVVWYAILDHRTDDAQITREGHVLYVGPNEQIVQLDPSGNVVSRWVATGLRDELPAGAVGVDTDTFHHEVEVLPNGNMLTLSTELREITTDQCPNYEPAAGDSLNVVGDVVVEFDPSTGDIVQELSMFDTLDPCRRTDRGFEAGFWNGVYGGMTTQDWTHGNAVFYADRRNLALVSLRHQDWVVAYRYVPGQPEETGKVEWILGEPTAEGDHLGYLGFEPMGMPFGWPYHQHAPMFTADGGLLLYDNGNLRPGTDFESMEDMPYTRAVEYRVNTRSETVEQTWEWRNPAADYAPFVGDADELPNGNILVTDGGILDPPSNSIRSPEHRKLARITEVLRQSTSQETVFRLTIGDDAETDFTGYTVYRAERVTNFPR